MNTFKAKTPPKATYHIEVADGLIFTVDSDFRLLDAVAWASGIEEWVHVSSYVTTKMFDKYAQILVEKIADIKESRIENERFGDAG